jgi:hypothetical protein
LLCRYIQRLTGPTRSVNLLSVVFLLVEWLSEFQAVKLSQLHIYDYSGSKATVDRSKV